MEPLRSTHPFLRPQKPKKKDSIKGVKAAIPAFSFEKKGSPKFFQILAM